MKRPSKRSKVCKVHGVVHRGRRPLQCQPRRSRKCAPGCQCGRHGRRKKADRNMALEQVAAALRELQAAGLAAQCPTCLRWFAKANEAAHLATHDNERGVIK